MLNMKIFLVGCSHDLVPRIKAALETLGAEAEDEIANPEELIRDTHRWDVRKGVFLYHIRTRSELPRVTRLAAAVTGRPIVGLVEGPDHSLLVAANRAGASQVVLLPLIPEDFHEAMDRVAAQYGELRGKTRVVAVTGVTGGSGATTLAANLAFEVAHLQQARTILLELALPMGRLVDQFALNPKFTTLDLIRNMDRLDGHLMRQVLTPVGENLMVLPGPYEEVEPMTPRLDHSLRLIACAKRISQVVVLDVPCTYDDLYFGVLAAADQVVLVGEQRIPSVRSLKLVRGHLARQASRSHVTVINRFDPSIEGFGLSKLEEILKASELKTVRNDPATISMALAHGRPLREHAPKSRVLADIDALVDHMFQPDEEAAANGTSLLGRLFRGAGRAGKEVAK